MSTENVARFRPRLRLVCFAALVILALLAGGYAFFRIEAHRIHTDKVNELVAIGQMKVDQIVQWRQERLGDATICASDAFLGTVAVSLIQEPDDSEAREELLQGLKTLRKTYRYSDALLLKSEGSILLAAADGRGAVDAATMYAAAEAAEARRAALSELFEAEDESVYIDAVAPVWDAEGHPAGFLVLRSDAETFLHPIVESWPIPSQSAETVLVKREGDDVLFLSRLRFRTDSTLSFRVPLTQSDAPSVQAVLGKQAVFEGRDYRGVKVIASLEPVPGSAWSVVAKVDASEILAEVRSLAWVCAALVAFCVLLATAWVAILYRQRQVRIYQDLYLAEQEKRTTEELLQATLVGIGDGVISTDERGRVVFINPVAEELTGWPQATARGKPLTEVFCIVNAQTRESCENPVAEVLATGMVVDLANHTVLIARDGTEHHIADSCAPIRDANGAVVGAVLVFRDQSVPYRAQRLRQARLALLEYATAHPLDRVLTKALDEVGDLVESPIGFYHFVDDDQQSLCLQQWSTRTLNEFCHAAGKGTHYGIDQAGVWVDCVRERKPVVHNDYASLPHKKGLPEGHAEVKRELVVPVMREGRLVAILGVGNKPADYTEEDVETVAYFADVTWQIVERKRAQEALLDQKQKYKALYDHIGAGVAMIGPDMRVMELNRRMQEWFPQTDLAQHPLCHQALNFLPRDSVCPNCPTWLTLQDGQMHESEIEKPTPEGMRYYRIVSTALIDQQGHVTAAIEMVDDVTERKLAEESLRESQVRLSAITDSAHDAVLMMDSEGLVSYWNPAAERIFGYAPTEAMGKNLHELITPQRYHEAHLAAFREFRHTGHGTAVGKTLELQAIRKDGKEVDVALSLSAVMLQGKWHAVGILRDITEQKMASEELRRSKETLEQTNAQLESAVGRANQMAVEAEAANIAKSQFLANMSHEIRTPMNGVIGMTGLLMDTSLTEEQRQYAEVVRSSGEALLSLVNDILDFSKIESGKLDLEELDFDLRATMEDTVELLAVRAHEKHLEFLCRIDPEVPTFLRGDPGRLRQILINLGGNAVKFTSRGEVVIEVRLESETDDRMQARFEVRDTGMGIPQDKIGLLFNAFEQVDASTTRRFGGTGLGLAISKRLVELMEGEIGIESVEGKGSTFWFTVAFGKQPPRERDENALRADVCGVRALAVDDNAINRQILSEQLESWGVRHVEAESAPEALDILRAARAEGDPFRIVLTDMQMPDMDGETLGEAIKADAELRDTILVMMTSLGRRGDGKRLESLGFSAYLTKPVKQSQLYDCLATVLSGPATPGKVSEAALVTRHTLSEARRQRVRILLAEDNHTNQVVALRTLEKMGYRADAVANGKEAIHALETLPYDIVFMDVQMPVMDGFAATRAIRSGKTKVPNQHIPIIAMTAHAMKGDREDCLDVGMDDYVSKPIAPRALALVLDKWLARDTQEEPDVDPAPGAHVRPTDGPPIFDRQGLLGLLMGDESLAEEIVADFLEDIPKQMSALKKHIDNGDAGQAGRQGHTIKGAAANVGALALSAVALDIERAGRDGRLDQTVVLFPELERQFGLLKTHLQGNASCAS